MKRILEVFLIVSVLAVTTLLLLADSPPLCGDAGGGGCNPFPQPAGTVAVNFTVDDSVNQVYRAGDLQWEGSFNYDAGARILTQDPNWRGPYPDLYDDGPWTCGGHEPANAIAGDHKWGVTVFVTPPADGGALEFEYGLNDANPCNPAGAAFPDGGSAIRNCTNGWVWRGFNSAFFVDGSQPTITATGQLFPAFGTNDVEASSSTRPTSIPRRAGMRVSSQSPVHCRTGFFSGSPAARGCTLSSCLTG